MKTKTINVEGDIFEINFEPGAKTGDIVFNSKERKFYPVFRLGTTNISFEKKFQSHIYKVVRSSRKKDRLPGIKKQIKK